MKRNFGILAIAALFFVSAIAAPLFGMMPDAAAHGKKKKRTSVRSVVKEDRDHKDEKESGGHMENTGAPRSGKMPRGRHMGGAGARK